MCRNIKTLFNFAPPATEDEIQASALQFVRKLSGFTNPSKANQAAFDRAVSDVNAAASEFRLAPVNPVDLDFHSTVSEFAANVAGSLSPFGEDVEFPLPSDRLGYQHPRPVNRPNLAGD